MNLSKGKRTLFYITTMMFWFAMYTYVPILTPYVEYLGGSLFMAGLVVGSYGFTQMLVRIPLGIWSDRIGKRKVFIIAGILCAIISSVGLGLSTNVWMVLFFRGLAGVAAGSWVAFTVLFSSYFEPQDAPKAMGLISFYTSVGQMIASTLGGFLAQYLGWDFAFYAGAVGGLIGLITSVWIVEPAMKKKQPIAVSELVSIGKKWPLLSVSLLAVLGQSIAFTTMFGFSPLYAVHIGFNKSELSLLTLVTILPNAIAGYVSGTLVVKRIGARWTVGSGFLLAAICTIAIPFTHSMFSLMVTQAFNGFGQGLQSPILMGLAIHSITADKRATAMGFFQAIYSVGMFGGPFLVGLLGKWIGLVGGFEFMGVVSVLAALLALWWIRATKAEADSRTTG